jgi:NAD(P)H-hydrate epimerase
VIADGQSCPVIVSGSNPGMATGGMGDVLAGIIGSLLGQLGDASLATSMAASLHLEAAGVASLSKGFMGLVPTDVIDALPGVLCKAERGEVVNAGERQVEV